MLLEIPEDTLLEPSKIKSVLVPTFPHHLTHNLSAKIAKPDVLPQLPELLVTTKIRPGIFLVQLPFLKSMLLMLTVNSLLMEI
jgi:hypothetical protein